MSGGAVQSRLNWREGRFVIPRSEFVPSYVKTYEEGRLREKVEEALELLRSCHVCPRDCQVNRLENKTGVCKSGRLARVTSAFTHFGEEDCLRGWNGSGTIFFAWCNLRCVFCQNFETSQQGDGIEVTAPQLAAIMLRLQSVGCHNINFVTPEHVVPQILEALLIAINGGLQLPLVLTPAHTTVWTAFGSWMGWSTFTCRISSCGIRSAALDTCWHAITPTLHAGL